MDDLILNPKSRTLLESYLAQPTHALLLTGINGVGLRTIATTLARQIAGTDVVVIEPRLHSGQKTPNINTDDIRGLKELARGRRRGPMVIVIDEVDNMTDKAPEAFLKALEEPGIAIHYVLASHRPEKLPETIRSRVQTIEIAPILNDESVNMLKTAKTTADRRQQILFLAAGRPAEIVRLLTDDIYFRSKARQIELAKDFLTASTYNRLKIISGLKQRDEARQFIAATSDLALFLAPKTPPAIIARRLELIAEVTDNLVANGNVRAQMTYLATSMV